MAKPEGTGSVSPENDRQTLGVDEGAELVVTTQGDSLRVISPTEAIRRARELVRSHIPENRCLSDELVADRLQESQIE